MGPANLKKMKELLVCSVSFVLLPGLVETIFGKKGVCLHCYSFFVGQNGVREVPRREGKKVLEIASCFVPIRM